MEWLKKQYNAWSDYFYPKPKPVAWNEVIQLDPALDKNPPYKAKIVADLVKWQHTNSGQEMLTALKDAQSRIPKGHHWQTGEWPIPDEDNAQFHHELRQITGRHTDTNKLFLYVAAEKENNFTVFDRYTNGGGYRESPHIVAMNPAKLSWIEIPKLVGGKKQNARESFLEVLQHETQHAVDYLNIQFGKQSNVTKPIYRECIETRGLHSEQALQRELGLPLRYAYYDPLLDLQKNYVRGASASPEGFARLRQELADLSLVDSAGCTLDNGLSSKSNVRKNALEKADNAMKAHGIKITR